MEDDRNGLSLRIVFELFTHFEASRVGQIDVQQDGVRTARRRDFQRLSSGVGLQNGEPRLLQMASEGVLMCTIVVHEQHSMTIHGLLALHFW